MCTSVTFARVGLFCEGYLNVSDALRRFKIQYKPEQVQPLAAHLQSPGGKSVSFEHMSKTIQRSPATLLFCVMGFADEHVAEGPMNEWLSDCSKSKRDRVVVWTTQKRPPTPLRITL